MIGIATPDELGHMQRQGPHPLGISGDVNRGHDRPQVPSHRGVQCQQHKRSFLRGRQLSPIDVPRSCVRCDSYGSLTTRTPMPAIEVPMMAAIHARAIVSASARRRA